MITPNHPHIQTALATSLGNSERLDAVETKTDHITVASPLDLNTMNSSIAANTALLAVATPAALLARVAALEAKMEFIPKAFGRFTTADPAVLLGTSYNVASVSRGATGQYSVVIDTDMTTANYTVMLAYEDATATIQTVIANTIATTGFNIGLRDASNAFSDASESVSFVVFENNT